MAKTKHGVRKTMKAISTKAKTERTKTKEAEARGTVALSIRFPEEQYKLLTRAAELKGWTPTNLLRVASLEKAAHIVNTETLTKLDFKKLAHEIAENLFSYRQWLGPVVGLEGMHPIDSELEESLRLEPAERLPNEALLKLKEAARFGGAEFLALIVEYSEGLAAGRLTQLPDPIDPTNPQGEQ